MFGSFPVVDGDGSLAEVDVFDTQTHGFHEAESGAIHELGGEFPWVFEVGEDGAHFFPGQHGGRASVGVAEHAFVEFEFRDAEDLAGEKDQGIEGLALGGNRDLAFEGEEIEISGDAEWTGGLRGLPESGQAEAGKTRVPMDVGFFRFVGEIAESGGAADFVADAGGFGFRGRVA